MVVIKRQFSHNVIQQNMVGSVFRCVSIYLRKIIFNCSLIWRNAL